MKKNNIILIGMMGAGKSTIAKELAKVLPAFKLIDIDKEIENDTNMKISNIFASFSEDYFRDLETKKIIQICKNDNQIIALGGGAFENAENRSILNSNGKTFYLQTTAEEIYYRIKFQTHRPLLKSGFGVEKIAEILNNRRINYQKAHYTIDTTKKSFYNIVSEILERIKY